MCYFVYFFCCWLETIRTNFRLTEVLLSPQTTIKPTVLSDFRVLLKFAVFLVFVRILCFVFNETYLIKKKLISLVKGASSGQKLNTKE